MSLLGVHAVPVVNAVTRSLKLTERSRPVRIWTITIGSEFSTRIGSNLNVICLPPMSWLTSFKCRFAETRELRSDRLRDQPPRPSRRVMSVLLTTAVAVDVCGVMRHEGKGTGQMIEPHPQCSAYCRHSPPPPTPTPRWCVKQNTATDRVANFCHRNNTSQGSHSFGRKKFQEFSSPISKFSRCIPNIKHIWTAIVTKRLPNIIECNQCQYLL